MIHEGMYRHESGFEIIITEDNKIFISQNHPLSLRLSDIFNVDRWTKIRVEGIKS